MRVDQKAAVAAPQASVSKSPVMPTDGEDGLFLSCTADETESSSDSLLQSSSSSFLVRAQHLKQEILMCRQSVATKRQSLALTASEQSFLDHVLEHGTDQELVAVEATLHNTALFVKNSSRDQQRPAAATDLAGVVPPTVGSTKRQEYLELRRRRCMLAAKAKWKQATTDDYSNADDNTTQNTYAQHVELSDDISGTPLADAAIESKKSGCNNSFVSNRSSFVSNLSAPESLLSICEENETKKETTLSKKEVLLLSLSEEKKSEEHDDDYEEASDEDPVDQLLHSSNSKTCLSPRTAASRSRKDSVASAVSIQQKNHRSELVKTASVSMYHGEGFEVGNAASFDLYENATEHYDPWMFETTDEDGHQRLDVRILGTSHHDLNAIPHVLSPMLMHSLQSHLPLTQRGESFWLKYSLVRDGASMISFLQHLRACKHTLLACETVDGEVFGFYGTQPWVVQPTYFGTGDSFLWKMKHSRILENGEQYHNGTLLEQSQREAEVEVYQAVKHAEHDFYQLCQDDKIAIGGGVTDTPQEFGQGEASNFYEPQDIGFALIFEDTSLLYGSSSACMTFQSPPLSKHHGT